MSITSTTGSVSMVGGTEVNLLTATTVLTPSTTKAMVQAFIRFNNNIAGDEGRIRVYETVNGVLSEPLFDGYVEDAQSQVFVTPLLLLSDGWLITVTMNNTRTVSWDIKTDNADVNVATWLGVAPNPLISNRVDATVGAMQSNVMTSGATDSTYVTELQAGLATSSAVAAVQADTDALQVDTAAIIATLATVATAAALSAVATVVTSITGRIPAALDGGRMDSVVNAIAAGVVTTIQTNLATSSSVAAVQADTDALQTAVAALPADVDTTLTASHGSGSWGAGAGPTPADIADAVLEEVVADHSAVSGSLAQVLLIVKGLSNGNTILDQTVYDGSGLLTAARLRVFATGAAVTAGTTPLATFTIAAVNGVSGPSTYKVTQA
jgi:hypothetical protein